MIPKYTIYLFTTIKFNLFIGENFLQKELAMFVIDNCVGGIEVIATEEDWKILCCL